MGLVYFLLGKGWEILNHETIKSTFNKQVIMHGQENQLSYKRRNTPFGARETEEIVGNLTSF